jgi:putative transposase
MPQSFANILVHIVFSTKGRKPFLNNDELRSHLYAYLSKLLKTNVDSPSILINGMPDHVHILCSLSRKHSIMEVLREIKSRSTTWLKAQSSETKHFAWQSGYGIFSVSESNCEQVAQYIRQQQTHHKKFSFQDEFRLLCQKHGVELDERYAWD